MKAGDRVLVQVYRDQNKMYDNEMVFGNTFADVPEGKVVCYLNSLLNFSFAINQGNFSAQYKVYSGPDWVVLVKKVK